VVTAAILNRCAEVGDDRRGGATRQARFKREEEREGGWVPADSGPRPAGASGVARPCHAAGRTGEGKGADRWATAIVPAAVPANRRAQCTVPGRQFKRDLNHILNSKVSNKFKLF
jgi:hypothetical protein